MLMEFPVICFEEIKTGMKNPERFGPLTTKCSTIIVSMRSKSGTGGVINVGSDDDGSVVPDFVSLLLYSILQLHISLSNNDNGTNL